MSVHKLCKLFIWSHLGNSFGWSWWAQNLTKSCFPYKRIQIKQNFNISAYFGYSFWPTKKDGDRSSLSYCAYYECCDSSYIRFDINGLKADFEKNLFGQHIASETILPALHSHHKNLDISQKPLVMSFHGTPGTGKNYVADRIVKYLYKSGDESKYVHKFRGRIDFPLASHVPLYRVSFINISQPNTLIQQKFSIFFLNCRSPYGTRSSKPLVIAHDPYSSSTRWTKCPKVSLNRLRHF